MRVSKLSSVVAVLLSGVMLLGCSSGGDDSADPDDTTVEDTTDAPVSTDTPDDDAPADGPVNLCDYLSDDDAEALNPDGKGLVSTILLGDFSYLGCTVGDVFSVSFGIRVIDDGTPLPDLLLGNSTEPLDGFGDEAYVSHTQFSGETVESQTVARFGDVIVYVRNDSLGYPDPDDRITDERVYEAMTAFAEALPDDVVETARTAEVDESVCPAVDSDVVESLLGTVVLARGGHADDADRCAYRGEDGAQIRLSSRASDEPVDVDPSGDPITLPNIDGAEGGITDSGNSVDLTIISPGERVTYVSVIGAEREVVDPDVAVALTEEFLGLVG